MAYAMLRGLPESRADYRIGTLAALLTNIHRSEGVDPIMPSDIIKTLAPDESEAKDEKELEPVDPKVVSATLKRMLGGNDGTR